MRAFPIFAVTALSAWLITAGVARAQPEEAEPHQQWEHDRFQTWEFITLPLLYAPALLRVISPPNGASWTDGFLLDDGIRGAFALESAAGRDLAIMTGNITWIATMLYPLVDVAVAAWIHDWDDVANQMALVNLQAFGVASFVFFITQRLLPRDRPFGPNCEEDPEYDSDCNTPVRYQSFPSGHFAMALTGALLTCMHHQDLPLYGAPWDGVACGVSLAAAGYTGLSRLLANAHWLSDVLLGGALGIFAGWFVPAALHYGLFDS